MYVIATTGHCVINGLGQVKVFEDREDAEKRLEYLVSERGDFGFRVQEIQIVKKGEQED
jgi:hypothetical protein